MSRNPLLDPRFLAANDFPVATRRPSRVVVPKPPHPNYNQNSFGSPAFKAANAPDTRPLPRVAAPKPPGPVNAYDPGQLPAVGAAVNNANQVAAGASTPAQLAALLGSGQSNSALLSQARQIVGYELDPQVKAAQAAYNQENRDYGWLINNLNRQTGVAKGDISTMFGALDQLLAAGQKKQAAAYDTAKQGVGSAYDQLSQMLSDTYGQASSKAQAEQQRLGISGPGQNDRLAADQAFMTSLAGEQKANAVSNVNTQAANQGAIASQFRASNQEVAPHLVAQITLNANQQQQELLKQHIDNLSKYKSQINLLNLQRPGKVQMVLQQLQDQLYQRQQDAAQLAFMNSVRAGELGISAAQLQLAQARLAQDGQIATNNAIAKAKELDLQAQKTQPQGTGLERAFGYMQTAYPDKSGKKQQDLQDALVDIINGNSNDPGYNPNATPGQGGYGIPGYNANFLAQYLSAADSAVTDRSNQGWGAIERNILRNAILKFFNK